MAFLWIRKSSQTKSNLEKSSCLTNTKRSQSTTSRNQNGILSSRGRNPWKNATCWPGPSQGYTQLAFLNSHVLCLGMGWTIPCQPTIRTVFHRHGHKPIWFGKSPNWGFHRWFWALSSWQLKLSRTYTLYKLTWALSTFSSITTLNCSYCDCF